MLDHTMRHTCNFFYVVAQVANLPMNCLPIWYWLIIHQDEYVCTASIKWMSRMPKPYIRSGMAHR